MRLADKRFEIEKEVGGIGGIDIGVSGDDVKSGFLGLLTFLWEMILVFWDALKEIMTQFWHMAVEVATKRGKI